MIDLHTHTNESDGSVSPSELVERAVGIGIEALAITDHDTFAGYDQAAGPARDHGLDLVCAIEMSARMRDGRIRSVHVLGYFLNGSPSDTFRSWILELQASRRERNIQLVENIQRMGVPLELAEVEREGRTLTGRPHFARVLVRKGYAVDREDAFQRFIGESAPAFVERHSPAIDEAFEKIADGRGLAVLAHPIRLAIRNAQAEEALIREMKESGLRGIEVYHSDHGARDVERYAGLAHKYGLAITGGSDFHGDLKPEVELGTGRRGNLNIPRSLLDTLRNTGARS